MPAATVWGLVENSMRELLATTMLEYLVSARRRNGKVDWVPRFRFTASRAAKPAEQVAKCI